MDFVTLARTARESLARGLGALQTPGAPPQLMASAEPIAHAMSALHRIEGSGGNVGPEVGAAALTAVRQALSQLQGNQIAHPAVEQAMDAIASSLGLVHQLSQGLQAKPSIAPAPPTQPSSAFQAPQAPPPQVAVVSQQPAYQQQPTYQPQPAAQQQPAPQRAYQQPQTAPQPAWQQPAPQPAPAPQYQQPAAPQPQPHAQQPAPQPAQGGMLRVQAELGAHSATNFYKGLSGNDVIDSGGIFVATYNLPNIGQPLIIKVSLPGGYEFEAQGVVRWTRESPASGADAPPGFGAQFTQISAEGRQLVYRYVRNREPLFHDDL
jgi:chemotaxis protein histidine kinase CheA